MLEENNSPKNKGSLIKLQFNSTTAEYYLFSSFENKDLNPLILKKEYFPLDALIDIKKRFQNIKFTNLNSLIEFCKSEKIVSLQIVFEWINLFIYKEERDSLLNYFGEFDLMLGVVNFQDLILQDKEELEIKNGLKIYQSNFRNFIIKICKNLFSSIDSSIRERQLDYYIQKLMLFMFMMDFDEASKIIIEVIQHSKEMKVKILLYR